MKKYRYRLILYACILCGLISLLTFSCFNSWKQIYNNRKLRAELETKYEKLVDNEDVLEGEVVKLQDPEYVAKYARERFLYSQDGEIIIKLPEDE